MIISTSSSTHPNSDRHSPSLWLVFIALVAIFVLVLTAMASALLRPSLDQALRLNED
ncbi:MAG TPA: hypothetical protein VF026_31720 [Ktedonobacteraceae bacterium]